MVIDRDILMGERWRSGLAIRYGRIDETFIRRLTGFLDGAGLI